MTLLPTFYHHLFLKEKTRKDYTVRRNFPIVAKFYLVKQNIKDEKNDQLHQMEGNASLASIWMVNNKLQSNIKHGESLYHICSEPTLSKHALIHLIQYPIFDHGRRQRQWHSYRKSKSGTLFSTSGLFSTFLLLEVDYEIWGIISPFKPLW